MPGYDHVFYLQYVHSIVEHAEHVHVGMNANVGNIPVNEHFARFGAGNLVGRYATV